MSTKYAVPGKRYLEKIACAEKVYGSSGGMISVDCNAEVIRAILRNSEMCLESEIEAWPLDFQHHFCYWCQRVGYSHLPDKSSRFSVQRRQS
jgi:hypothetical protein